MECIRKKRITSKKIAVFGSLSRDITRTTHTTKPIESVGGTVYYAGLALAELNCNVLVKPLLARKDKILLKAFKHPKISLQPEYCPQTICYQMQYINQKQDQRQSQITATSGSYQQITENLEDYNAILLGPLHHEEFNLSLLQDLRQSFKGKIAIDLQGVLRQKKLGPLSFVKRFNLNPYLLFFDIIKASLEEALYATQTNNIDDCLKKIKKFSNLEFLITNGSHGSWILTNNTVEQIKAYQAKRIVDATGCGDTYLAAYLVSRLSGQKPVRAGNFAAKIAAQKITIQGPYRNIANAD